MSVISPLLGGVGGMLALGLLAKAALILAAAWLLARLSLRGSAALRHGIWAVALGGVLALPIVGHWLPALTVEIEIAGLAAPSEPAPTRGPLAAPARGTATPVMEQSLAPFSPGSDARPRSPVTATPPPDEARELGGIGWLGIFILIWSAGVLLRLLWFALQLRKVRWLSGYTRPEVDSPAVRLAERLALQLGIRRRVCVVESAWASMPLTWGVLRPIILLPEEASAWPEARLRVVLLHELGHIRRWDYLMYLVAEVACALYWPLPLVWLARARVRKEQEQACDDLVLASGTTAVEYAEHLLAIASSFYGNRWALSATVSMAREVSLKDRIRTILDSGTNRRPALSGYGVLVLLVLSGFALPVAAIRPGGAEVEPEAAVLEKGDIGGAGEAASPQAGAEVEIPADESLVASTWLWLEPEDGARNGPMESREDLNASSGGYVVVPDGSGNDAPEGGPGQVSLTFQVPAAGEYVIWGRAIGANDNDNSFYISVDEGEEIRWDIETDGGRLLREWGWVPIRDPAAPTPDRALRRFPLTAGPHTLRVRNREDGTRLDRLLITGDPAYVPAGRGAAGAGYRPTYRWMEVEQARLEGSIRYAEDQSASGGQSIAFQRGRGSEPSGIATFTFDAETPGRYVVWGRVLAPDDEANSFYASLNGGEEVIWDAPGDNLGGRAGRWSWSPLNAREYNGRRVDPLLLDLAPGRHELRLRTREANIRLDGVLVTNDVSFRPRGIWPAVLPDSPVGIWLEAESALLDAPFLVRGDAEAEGGRYVHVEERERRWDEPGADGAGSAILRFNVPQPGLYNFWARTLAHDGNANSFWVRVNDGDWIRWNEFPKDGTWSWSMVHDEERGSEVAQFELLPGENTLEFAPREGGARIDRVLVTNDPLAAPDDRIDG
jgi:beta-lactamase regulating signal transducer with metallopeptidase domain